MTAGSIKRGRLRSGRGWSGRGWSGRRKAATALLALTALLLAALGGWALYLNHLISAIPRMDIDLGPSRASGRETTGTGIGDAGGRGVSILLAGVDADGSLRVADQLAGDHWVPGSRRTDTIMVLHLTADRRQAYLISIPRDTWVQIDGYGMAKINAAFSYGGPRLFVRTIEQFTGLEMDHLAIVDWTGFKELTDALGGVTVEQTDGRPSRLDGKAALRYVRERYSLPRGDLDRMQRQQNVLRSLSDELRSTGTLANPVRLTRSLRAVAGNVVVDKGLTNAAMRRLALSLGRLGRSDFVEVTVPVKRFDDISGQSVVIVDRDGARGLFGAAIADELDGYLATHRVDRLPKPTAVP